MIELFEHIRKFQVGELDVSHLDGDFTIKRSLRRQANTCELRIYNLTPDQLAEIRNENRLYVEVGAGYSDDDRPTTLFRGFARREVYTSVDNTETILQVRARDGERSNIRRVNRSYGPGTLITKVRRDLAQEMGLGLGNMNDFDSEKFVTTRQDRFPQGIVTSGPAWRAFDRIIRAQGLRWSVQNGAIQILRQRRTRSVTGKLISSATGMIGSPTRDKNGRVSCRVLLQSGLEPGRVVKLESRLIEGTYEIQETTYKGSTHGTKADWFADLVLKPLNT